MKESTKKGRYIWSDHCATEYRDANLTSEAFTQTVGPHLEVQWHVHAESPPGEADIYSTVHMELTILKQFLLLLLYSPNLKQPQF